MIKAIFFDFYNTLVHFHPPREEVQMKVAAEFGLMPTRSGITRGYAKADAYMTNENARSHIQKMSRDSRLEFFAEYERLILKGSGIDITKALAREVWGKVRSVPTSLELFEDVPVVLRELNERSLILGLISNIHQNLDAQCDRLGISEFLDFIVTSKSAGVEKPHSGIFLNALEQASVKPTEALHVGDQYGGDVVGARNVNMRAVLIDRENVYPEHTDVERITSLTELLEPAGPRTVPHNSKIYPNLPFRKRNF